MRIITGKNRGAVLSTLEGANTRPTSERAKEAIFSMLGDIVNNAVVLDMFAGSGQMGLETISRGAKKAYFCDSARDAIQIIQKNIAKTRNENQCVVFNCDYLKIYFYLKEKISLAFIDPPYALKLIPSALRSLISNDVLEENAVICCESASFDDVFMNEDNIQSKFEILKQTHYGIACITLLKYIG